MTLLQRVQARVVGRERELELAMTSLADSCPHLKPPQQTELNYDAPPPPVAGDIDSVRSGEL